MDHPRECYGTHDAGGLQGFHCPQPRGTVPKERYTHIPRSLRQVRHARCFNGECPSEATDKIGVRHIYWSCCQNATATQGGWLHHRHGGDREVSARARPKTSSASAPTTDETQIGRDIASLSLSRSQSALPSRTDRALQLQWLHDERELIGPCLGEILEDVDHATEVRVHRGRNGVAGRLPLAD